MDRVWRDCMVHPVRLSKASKPGGHDMPQLWESSTRCGEMACYRLVLRFGSSKRSASRYAQAHNQMTDSLNEQ